MTDYIGQQLGNYSLIKLLGHGGFADVYLGEHVYLNTQAAIKILHTQVADEDIESFRNEALTIAHLVHPHIVRVLDFDVENNTPFLVMDYAPDGTLRQRYPKGARLSPMVFMPYVKQVASALQYAHDQKLIHRDVKPENMLIARSDDILLSDFGIALVAQSSRHLSTESVVIGTVSYMAPEQIQGKARPASDQYSLAAVVYEWVSGRKLFTGSYLEIVTQQLSAPPPPLNEQGLAVPYAVNQVLMRALAKDYHQRFARVQDFADALEQAYRVQEPIPVQSSSSMKTPRRSKPNELSAPIPPQASRPYITAPESAPSSPFTSQPVQYAQQVQPIRQTRREAGCGLRAALNVLVLSAVLLCGLGYAAFHYFQANGTPAQAAGMSNDFVQAVSSRNYDQAYSYLGSSITNGTSKAAFRQQALSEDGCYGPITGYTEGAGTTTDSSQIHNYTVTRSKRSSPYTLHVTVQRDLFGNWHITDYNSNVDSGQPACH